jgi:early secretory antigenic target protein ESAT-6
MTQTTMFNKGGIDQGAADLALVARTMKQELDELRAYIGTKAQEWEGPAREAYRVAQGEWDRSFLHMQTTLHLSSSAVQQIGENYQTAEQRNASIWG